MIAAFWLSELASEAEGVIVAMRQETVKKQMTDGGKKRV